MPLGEADWDDPLNSSPGGVAWAAWRHTCVFLRTSMWGSLTVVTTPSQARHNSQLEHGPQTNGASSFTQSSAFGHRNAATRLWSHCSGEGPPRQVQLETVAAKIKKEHLVRRARLPYAPRLKRILLKNGYSLRLNLRDVRGCFFPG